MELTFIKAEAWQNRYKDRARKARKWARFVMLLLFATSGAAIWQDDNLGTFLQKRAYVAIDSVDAATENFDGAGKIVQLALAKLNF